MKIGALKEQLDCAMLEESEYRDGLPPKMPDGTHCKISKQISIDMAAGYAYLTLAARSLKIAPAREEK